MQGELTSYSGSCHCGAVRFSARTTLSPAVRCNCSFCRRRGAVMANVQAEDFRILAGEDALGLYQWNTRVARHYFCRHCGVYTFHRPRMRPGTWRVNVGCLEGVDPYALEATVQDGAALSSHGR
ncbi:MAG: GFA family protein [Betaproteobacteria bacterium]